MPPIDVLAGQFAVPGLLARKGSQLLSGHNAAIPSLTTRVEANLVRLRRVDPKKSNLDGPLVNGVRVNNLRNALYLSRNCGRESQKAA